MADKISVVLLSDRQSIALIEAAEERGLNVLGTSIWTGPVPEGSFMPTGIPGVQMSTPEFRFLRAANGRDDLYQRMRICTELLSRVTTWHTDPSMSYCEYERRSEPHTTVERVLEYLSQIEGTHECARAKEMLSTASGLVNQYEYIIPIAHTPIQSVEGNRTCCL